MPQLNEVDDLDQLLRQRIAAQRDLKFASSEAPSLGQLIASGVAGVGTAMSGGNGAATTAGILDADQKDRFRSDQLRLKAMDNDTDMYKQLASLQKLRADQNRNSVKSKAEQAKMVGEMTAKGLDPVFDTDGTFIGVKKTSEFVSPSQLENNKEIRAKIIADGQMGRLQSGQGFSAEENAKKREFDAKQAEAKRQADFITHVGLMKEKGYVPVFGDGGVPSGWAPDPNYKPKPKDPLDALKIQAQIEDIKQRRQDHQDAADRKSQEKSDANAKDISKRFEKSGAPEMTDLLTRLNNLIPGGLDSNEDIPGVGETAWAPQFLLSHEGQDVRQTATELSNVLLKYRSGGAVTPQESDRLREELAMGATKSDRQLRQAVKNVSAKLAAGIRNIEAGYNPNDLEVYRSRPGSVSSGNAIYQGSAPAPQDPMVRVISPDGKKGSIPQSKLKAALSRGFTAE